MEKVNFNIIKKKKNVIIRLILSVLKIIIKE